jgi:hypothetical protein
MKPGIRYSNIFYPLPITKVKKSDGEIATFQEITGEKEKSVDSKSFLTDFQLRSDGLREEKKKHNNCDHNNDPPLQRAVNTTQTTSR